MSTTVAKISAIQDEMAKTQKNKATSYHLGQLKGAIIQPKDKHARRGRSHVGLITSQPSSPSSVES